MPVATRLPFAPLLRSRIMRSGSTSITSISAGSFIPPVLVTTLAFAPMPVAGPDTCHSVRMWSVKASWLAITSRYA